MLGMGRGLRLDDYDFVLPSDRIAHHAVSPADSCDLCVYQADNQQIDDAVFRDIVDLLDERDVLVCNDSRVMHARLRITEPRVGEIFFLRLSDQDPYTCEALISPGKKFRVWTTWSFPARDTRIDVVEMTEEGRVLRSSRPWYELLDAYGEMPLPPYVDYSDTAADQYQSLFAQEAWSVAAPTASLHFTRPLLERLHHQGVVLHTATLHIGLWTFQRVESHDITQHAIHDEPISLGRRMRATIAQEKHADKRHIAVGTTVTRTLESMPYLRRLLRHDAASSQIVHKMLTSTAIARWDTLTADVSLEDARRYIPTWHVDWQGVTAATELFLYPGCRFFLVDALITNFHLPKSSLLMLVAAFIWYDEMCRIYQHALAGSYRFYSFGDAMFLDKRS